MSQPSPSASLVSLATTTNDDVATPTASTTNLIPQSSQTKQVTTPAPASSAPHGTSAPSQPAARIPAPKDYESAFANLSSSYGWGTGVPMKTSTKKKDKKEKKDKKDKKGKATATSSSTPGQNASAS
ncbi:hypothetical protein K466DRAFT_596482 [Polyporus arcularius HHB13444]|uniref:Uncharacterized protein n=1 Tax=Polyporus arcularius HHB13444 TaxID=1314778 RepID=A0A5C3PN62_9APHY|nr:hypothetical protein K466DRAFT_596482 [Polyporus arcularius HHB13444]